MILFKSQVDKMQSGGLLAECWCVQAMILAVWARTGFWLSPQASSLISIQESDPSQVQAAQLGQARSVFIGQAVPGACL